MTSLIAYISFLFFSTAAQLQRRHLARKHDNSYTSQIQLAFHSAAVLCIASFTLLLVEPLRLSNLSLEIVMLILGSGFFGAVTIIFAYRAQKYVEAGTTHLLVSMSVPVTILLGTLFLSESLSSMQIIGTCILFFSMYVIGDKSKETRYIFDRFHLMMLGSGLSLGILLFFERLLQIMTNFVTGALLSWWSVFLTLGAFYIFLGEDTHSRSEYSLNDIITTGILRFFQNISWIVLVFVISNVSLAAALSVGKIITLFIGGAIFLREHSNFSRKLFGACLATLGLLLILT